MVERHQGAVPGISKIGEKPEEMDSGFASPQEEAVHVGPQALSFLKGSFHMAKYCN
jgi:hypothetical protein